MIRRPAIPLDDQRPHLKMLRYILSPAETATFRRPETDYQHHPAAETVDSLSQTLPCLSPDLPLSFGSPNIGDCREIRTLTDQGWF